MSLGKSSINSQQDHTARNLTSACTYEFENFRLDASHLMLYRNGSTIALKPKVVETLVALVERSGDVVSKEELMARLWPDSFVEEGNLSQNIYLLRRTLGDTIDGKPMIETFWRRGYRFNGSVRRNGELDLIYATRTKTLLVTEEIGEDLTQPVLTSGRSFSRRIFSTAVIVIGTVMVLATAYIIFPRMKAILAEPPSSLAHESSVQLIRLTPDLDVGAAAISPDGKYAAYDLHENGKHSLWIKDIATGGTVQLGPTTASRYSDISFSPDGSYIYYNGYKKGHPNATIFRITLQGGEPEVVAYDSRGPVTFSPDSRHIAFVRGPVMRSVLAVANADGTGERELAERKEPDWFETWGSNISWSPDGSRIVLCGGSLVDGKRRHQLIEVSTADGSQKDIPARDWNYIDDVLWLSDQSGLIVRARENQGSPWQIWRVSYPDGTVARITNDLEDYDELSLSADGRRLIVARRTGNWNLWSIPVGQPEGGKQLTSGPSALDGTHGVAVTGDGRVVYTSPRDGNLDLWMLHPDGSSQTQLTRKAGDFNGRPQITRDGRYIVFDSSRSGSSQIWRMNSDGSNPIALTDVGYANSPQPSPDGQWIYFNLIENNRYMIGKVAIDGGAVTILKDPDSPMFVGPVSPDGTSAIVGHYDDTSSKPWKHSIISLETGQVIRTFDGFKFVQGWSTDGRSLFALAVDATNLLQQPVDGSEPKKLTEFQDGTIRSFALTNDLTSFVIARGNPSSEAVLITNF